MFGITRIELINNLEIIRKDLCCYTGEDMCDCKYDPVEKYNSIAFTEHTGCPEIRQIITMIKNMTDEEFAIFSVRSNINIK